VRNAAHQPDSRTSRPAQRTIAPSAQPAGARSGCTDRPAALSLLYGGDRLQAARAHGMGSGIKEPDPCPGGIKARRLVLDANRADRGAGGDGRIGRGQPNQAPIRGNPRQALQQAQLHHQTTRRAPHGTHRGNSRSNRTAPPGCRLHPPSSCLRSESCGSMSGFTTRTPRQLKPWWRSSVSSRRAPPSAETLSTRASQVAN